MAGDFDGDGKSDIIAFTRGAAGTGEPPGLFSSSRILRF